MVAILATLLIVSTVGQRYTPGLQSKRSRGTTVVPPPPLPFPVTGTRPAIRTTAVSSSLFVVFVLAQRRFAFRDSTIPPKAADGQSNSMSNDGSIVYIIYMQWVRPMVYIVLARRCRGQNHASSFLTQSFISFECDGMPRENKPARRSRLGIESWNLMLRQSLTYVAFVVGGEIRPPTTKFATFGLTFSPSHVSFFFICVPRSTIWRDSDHLSVE